MSEWPTHLEIRDYINEHLDEIIEARKDKEKPDESGTDT